MPCHRRQQHRHQHRHRPATAQPPGLQQQPQGQQHRKIFGQPRHRQTHAHQRVPSQANGAWPAMVLSAAPSPHRQQGTGQQRRVGGNKHIPPTPRQQQHQPHGPAGFAGVDHAHHIGHGDRHQHRHEPRRQTHRPKGVTQRRLNQGQPPPHHGWMVVIAPRPLAPPIHKQRFVAGDRKGGANGQAYHQGRHAHQHQPKQRWASVWPTPTCAHSDKRRNTRSGMARTSRMMTAQNHGV